jgi:hypothetical protein
MSDTPFQWAKSYLGLSRLTYQQQRHRVAIGKALIFELHNRAYGHYTRYMRANDL